MAFTVPRDSNSMAQEQMHTFLAIRGNMTDVGGDVGCEDVLVPLVKKEATFSQWLNRVKPG